MTLPVSLDTTQFIGRSFGLPDSRRETQAARFLNQRINYITDREDESFVRWMQDGMRSSAFPEQQLSSREQGVRAFHKRIQKVIPAANLLNRPDSGTLETVNQQLTVE